MTGQQQTATYQVEQLGEAPDGTPLWGVRRPDRSWYQSMGKPAWYIGRGTAERDAAELNKIHGLVP